MGETGAISMSTTDITISMDQAMTTTMFTHMLEKFVETNITNHGDTMAMLIMEMPTMTGVITETMETTTDTEIISHTVATVNGDSMETTEIGIMILDTMDMTMVISEHTTEILATTDGATMMSTMETGAGAITVTTELTMTMTSDLDTTPSTSISD